MNILIDMENLRFVHKHSNATALLLLAEIEMPHLPVRVEPCDCDSFLKKMSDMEMFLLYKNSIGVHPVYVGDKLRAVLMECVSRMPISALDINELRAQVAGIPKDDDQPYKYIRSSLHAQELEELFDIPAISINPSLREESFASKGPRWVAQELFPGVNYDEDYRKAVSVLATVTTLAPTPIPQEELFDIMDSIMADAGCPTDPGALTKVMNDIISALMESFNMTQKRAQNEFILWARARASLA